MRVLLVEDEPDLGAAIKRTLTQQKYLVDWVIDGDEAWGYLEDSWTEYTLAIFDWMLPKISGLELCKRLRKHQNSLPILMLTAKDSMEDKVTGLDAGADDYLVKPFGMAELLARLRALQRRSPQFQPQKLTVGNLTLDYGNNVVSSQDAVGNVQEITLTYKEFQLLEYFMKHPNQILTTEQIRNQLWEVNAEPVSNVVAAQMRLLRRKLVNGGCENMIETLHGLGYRFNFN
ncbi:response regulator transcription factor [Nodularia spumigena CS-584]|jgi:DNA-binding response OmpR family regulator|uniref:Two-component system response regulator RppA n=1 Tax=Nodularia spumigena UHCC 0060 TaxID=3110300 RepID=A0ABU5UL54_NODSP|nr:two-component system response regulator RppA [Nodularia spumigena]AHJ28930.1 two-component response regulator [Nodularia spumigena CCY9414]EAW45358.1 two-component response regulator [Nodularia spumigena CCY9414]MDB9382841.1 response regulator transcription factor [Nodularia spumigena CS-584]MEA5525258.1 two-component system response regulator RppA [Nodularia spumigena UHCC 0143]MEA5557011.1 two-component system response regulator RppA [Nodularia spumigena CH309]